MCLCVCARARACVCGSHVGARSLRACSLCSVALPLACQERLFFLLVSVALLLWHLQATTAEEGEADKGEDINSVMQNAEFLSSVLGTLPGVDINDEGVRPAPALAAANACLCASPSFSSVH